MHHAVLRNAGRDGAPTALGGQGGTDKSSDLHDVHRDRGRLFAVDLHDVHGAHGAHCRLDAFELHQRGRIKFGASVRIGLAAFPVAGEPKMIATRHRCAMTWRSFDVVDYDSRTQQGLQRIGQLVRRRRRLLGLSQRQLERLSGVDQTVISRLENGRLGGLRWSRFARLVGALGGLARDDPFPGWKEGHH
jgi:hypothetical protein